MVGVKRFESNEMMSQAVSYGGLVYLSGQIAWHTRAQDVTAQTQEVLSSIDRLLHEAKTDKARLLSASIWLADIKDFQAMNEVWLGWVDTRNPPVRATVQAGLAFPELKVEIQVIAAAGD